MTSPAKQLNSVEPPNPNAGEVAIYGYGSNVVFGFLEGSKDSKEGDDYNPRFTYGLIR